MPKPDYQLQAHVLIACSGASASATHGDGPRGKFTSKAQGHLAYAVADVRAWEERFSGAEDEAGVRDMLDLHVLLEEPTGAEVREAIDHAVERLDFYFDQAAGGSLNLVFSGHGRPNGDIVLQDGALSPDELVEWCAAGRAGDDQKTRHLRAVFDSCYSGLTLARVLLHPSHWDRFVLRDGFAACLPSQEAFELDRFGHGVLTHTMLRPEAFPLEVSPAEWTEERAGEFPRAQRETTQYLTNGQQHALDLINGHYISLKGGKNAAIEDAHRMSLEELRERLDRLPTRRRPSHDSRGSE